MSNLATIKGYMENESMKKKFHDMLGKKATGFMTSLINIVQNDKLLIDAEPNSIMYAAATAATLDLPINPNLGFAYILGYKNHKTGETKAQFQLGYKGFIQLAQRSGQFKTISASPVYEGQIVNNDPLRGITFDWNNKLSDKVIGYAGYFELLNGFEKTLFMTVEELQKHGKLYSANFKKFGSGLWADNFDAMATKTVIKLLLSKFAPLSVDMQKAVTADQGIIRNIEGDEIDYIDNTPETTEDIAKTKDQERILKQIEKIDDLDELSNMWSLVEDLDPESDVAKAYMKKKGELEG